MSRLGEGTPMDQSAPTVQTVGVKYEDRKTWLTFHFLYRKRGKTLVEMARPALVQVLCDRCSPSPMDSATIPGPFPSPRQLTWPIHDEKQGERS